MQEGKASMKTRLQSSAVPPTGRFYYVYFARRIVSQQSQQRKKMEKPFV
jgi:hypothetical protein